MKAWLLASLVALSAFVATPGSTQAAGLQGPLGCTVCVCRFGKMHFHGPLYNYGPYSGYYPFEPYGPWTSDLRYNPQCNNGKCGNTWNLLNRSNCNTGGHCWKGYAISTWKNVFHRTHPCGNRVGCHGCK